MSDKTARQAQLYDSAALKPCHHTMLCEPHLRCISTTTKKVCVYRCSVCAPIQVQHA